MTPYYEHEGITIYHGDCIEILPTLGTVDLVLTDPPFYLPAHISASRKSWPRSIGNVAVMSSYFGWTFAAIADRIKATGAFYSFCDSTSYAVFMSCCYPIFDRTQCIVWDKGVGGLGNGWRHSHELILHGAFNQTLYSPGFRRDVLRRSIVPSADRHHASEKPIELIVDLISAHTDGIILDPFMGSGTTLRAAKDLDRKAIGIEIDERYCEIAAKRMSQEVLQFT